jgi:AcrR family transcriptional regulator
MEAMADTPPPTPSLPRGRHGLSREQVAASQRSRLFLAMAEAMADKGYAATSVADVLARAGESRETYYQQFSSKLECFVGAYDAAGELLSAWLDDVLGVDGPPLARFDRALAAYLDALASHLPFARLFLVEVYAAGPAAFDRRAVIQRRFADGLATLLGARDDDARFACEALVAAISSLVTGPIVRGDAEALRALHGPLVTLVHNALEGAHPR